MTFKPGHIQVLYCMCNTNFHVMQSIQVSLLLQKGNEKPSGQTELLQAEEEDKEAVHQVNNDSSEVEKASEQGKGEPMKSKAEKQETSEVIQEAGTGPQETSEAIKVEGENEFIRTANETTKTERYQHLGLTLFEIVCLHRFNDLDQFNLIGLHLNYCSTLLQCTVLHGFFRVAFI